MTKTATRDGEYILLHWDCDHPDEEYIRGHVTADEFRAVFERERNEGRDQPPIPIPAEVRHEYGRWAMNGQDEYGNPAQTLKTYPDPGAGRFKLTVVLYAHLYPLVLCGICECMIRGPREIADGKPNHWQCTDRRKREQQAEEYELQKAAGWTWGSAGWQPPAPSAIQEEGSPV